MLPSFSLREEQLQEIRRQTFLLAETLHVIGLCNIQYAIRGNKIYLIEANPPVPPAPSLSWVKPRESLWHRSPQWLWRAENLKIWD